MQQYLDLLQHVLENGTRQANRTGVDTLMVPGAMMQFDLRDGFPAVTTKKLAFQTMRGELLGFFRGYTNADDFEKLGCNIWRQNADENQSWLNNPYRRGQGDLGRIYGAQWTDWGVYTQDMYASNEFGMPMYTRSSLNQLNAALVTLIRDPNNRRIIVNGWRPDEFDQMALPPCHVLYQFLANPQEKLLHLTMYQRSCDLFLGVPFNIASASLFLAIMAKLIGYEAATFTHFLADTHIYVNHLDQVHEQLSREPLRLPQLVLHGIEQVTLENYRENIFATIQPEQIELAGYTFHPPIKAPMAV